MALEWCITAACMHGACANVLGVDLMIVELLRYSFQHQCTELCKRCCEDEHCPSSVTHKTDPETAHMRKLSNCSVSFKGLFIVAASEMQETQGTTGFSSQANPIVFGIKLSPSNITQARHLQPHSSVHHAAYHLLSICSSVYPHTSQYSSQLPSYSPHSLRSK